MTIKNEERHLQAELNGISCVALDLRPLVRHKQSFLTNDNNKERVISFIVRVNGRWKGRSWTPKSQ